MENNDLEVFRKKTQMVVYAIERGIGNFLKDNSNDISLNIQLLNFGDLLQEFSKISDNQKSTFTKELKSLADKLEIATIRNICAHPIRDFELFYWYRICAFASDPNFQSLKIKEPAEALACCESGQISNPPESWLENLTVSTVANNLPEQEQYDVTGLIGRTKEVDNLVRDILDGRNNIISLVGPGGVGKTSLAIEVARKLADKQFSKNKFTSIIFVSLKSEFLTADGIVKTNINGQLFENLEEYFIRSLSNLYGFDDLKSHEIIDLVSDDNILVILDNLENTLVENIEAYENLLDQLPAHWRIVLTSRIPVNGAKNVSIRYLTNNAIEDLARKYHLQLIGREVDSSILNQLIEASQGNPLALKLIIDRLSFGVEFFEAKSKTKEDVLEYTFTQLIQTLDEGHHKILECIFVLDSASRQQITEFTLLDNDSLTELISKLFRTSLIDKNNDDGIEIYKIASALRDSLSRSPLNFQIRQEYSKKLTSIKILKDTAPIDPTISLGSFHPQCPIDLKNIATKIINIWKSTRKRNYVEYSQKQKETVREFANDIDKYEGAFKKYPDYFRLKSMSKTLLSDNNKAYEYAKKCYEMDKEWIVNSYFYADLLINLNNNIEAIEVLSPYIKFFLSNLDSLESNQLKYHPSLIREIFSTFFKAHIWEGQSQNVLEYTKKWGAAPGVIQGIFSISRASALRRIAEPILLYNEEKRENFKEAFLLLKFCKNELNFFSYTVEKEAIKLREEYLFVLRNPQNKIFIDEITNYVKELTNYIGDSDSFNLSKHTKTPPENTREYNAPENAIEVNVFSIGAGFAFAEDGINKYFIPFSNFINETKVSLSIGQKIKIWGLDNPPSSNGAVKAEFAKF
jgi:GTPase SAR1 family protein